MFRYSWETSEETQNYGAGAVSLLGCFTLFLSVRIVPIFVDISLIPLLYHGTDLVKSSAVSLTFALYFER